MRRMIWVQPVTWLGWLCIGVAAYAQMTPSGGWAHLRELSTQDGLPSMTIYTVTSDGQGGLWLGTEAGLCRYNGRSFTLISNPAGKSTAIDRPMIDANGKLWCKNFSGQVFRLVGDTLQPLVGSAGERFLQLDRDARGRIWVLTNRELLCYAGDSVPTRYPLVSYLGSLPEGISVGPRWLLLVYSRSIVRHALTDGLPAVDTTVQRSGLTVDYSQGHWAFYPRTGEVLRLDSSAAWVRPMSQPNAVLRGINRVVVLPSGSLALATDDGLYLEDRARKRWLWLLSGQSVSDVWPDGEGTLWVSTLFGGLHRFVNSGVDVMATEAFAPGQQLHAVQALPDASLLLGLDRGQILWLQGTQLLGSGWRVHQTLAVTSLCTDARAENVYAIESRIPLRVGSIPKRIRTLVDVKAFAVGRQWLVTAVYNGLEAVPLDRSVEPFPMHNLTQTQQQNLARGRPTLLSGERVRAVAMTENEGALLIGYESGLVWSTARQRTPLRLPSGESVIARTIVRLRGDRFAVGTFRQGVLIVQNGKIERQLGTNAGWNSEPTLAMAAFGDTAVLATESGLQLFTPKSALSRLVGAADGLPDPEIRSISATREGIWVASAHHLTQVPYTAFRSTPLPFQLSLAATAINGVDTSLGQPLHVPHWVSQLQFRFRTSTLRYTDRVRYAYRLTPGNTGWTPLPKGDELVRLQQLKPGKYVLQVRADISGLPGVLATLDMPIHVEAPVWERAWFLALVAVSLFGVGTVVYRRRVKSAERLAAQERSVRLAQLSALRAQMNPHFLFNALNTLQDAILQADTPRAARLLQVFARLLRHVVDHAPHQTLSLADELSLLNLYIELQKARFAGELSLKFEVNVAEGTEQRHIPAMFVLPFLENAFEHGLRNKRQGERMLSILFFSGNREQLHCRVEDNGIGRVAARAIRQEITHSSVGLVSTQERLRLFNEMNERPIALTITDLEDASGHAAGTRVDLYLPAFPAHGTAA